MNTAILQFLRVAWLPLVFIVAAAGVAYNVGETSGRNAGVASQRDENQQLTLKNEQLAAQVLAAEQEKRQAAELQVAALQQAQADATAQRVRADELAVELLDVKTELTKTTQKLKEGIDRAVKNDSNAFTGIGPDSLRLYRASLGYADDTVGMSDAPGRAAVHPTDAARPGRGLSPAGLLNHAADYGAWCLTLRGQLEKLNAYYKGGKDK
ncbi:MULTISPECIES: hypothetical protein [Dickeya]|uniref:Uncharacterized protein n=1 Tax=Dickeya aquatica TaxID=1401087 RepID=A0A375A9H7_9GAMM|nr:MULTISPECIES: hypothetical protein [Dickeya]SLM62647.1 hypothetical protein DAQ1742_01705 [Dickeya aquatica]SLM64001.1 hypothetical protein DAQ1742_03178 [Dickeya aquatica]SLM64501.1 hypothetical protein DAQ1742_03707 [Dickeya aquatica]